MKQYIIALLDKDSARTIETLTRHLQRKIKPRKRTSFYGVVIGIVEDSNPKDLEIVLKDLLDKVRYFKLDIKGNVIYDKNLKTIGIDVNNFGYIKSLSRNINTVLDLKGFNIKYEQVENPQLILYNGGNTKVLNTINNIFAGKEYNDIFRVDRLQVWKNFNFRKDSIVSNINLDNPNII